MKNMNREIKTAITPPSKHFNGGKKIIKPVMVAATLLARAILPFTATSLVYAENTTFQVNVKESLTVSITSQTAIPTGEINEFLRNKYTLNVSSNNAQGFTASMYSVADTNLVNKSLNDQSIPTLSNSSTRGAFPANYWGYSLRDSVNGSNTVYGETDAGNNNSNYYPLVSNSSAPITVLHSDNHGSGTQEIYFGAKADSNKAAGTYSGIVVISVVSGVIDSSETDTPVNPITPENPVGPNADNEVAKYMPAPKGNSSNGVTTYTYRRTNASTGETTTTTEISDGDNRNAYNGYIPPQGVKEKSTFDINNESSLAAGLATTATVAAAAGMFFFILAKRREDEDDDEENSKEV